MTRVLLVDDGATDRAALKGVLRADPEIEVVAEAADGEEAVSLTDRLQPDVVVMDVLMPRVDGYAATLQIMQRHPCPIVLVSAVYPSEAVSAVRALSAGAVSILEKPGGPAAPGYDQRAAELVRTVKLMHGVQLVRRAPRDAPPPAPTKQPRPRPVATRSISLVAIAASTGGPRALADVLAPVPATTPVAVLVVQHIGRGFERGLALWLREETSLAVEVAEAGRPLEPGVVLIAPAGSHLGVARDRTVLLDASPPIGGHRPSATFLFRTAGAVYGARAAGVILTGMGRDGVEGMAVLHRAGGYTIAQDQSTSVVYGMPGAAVAAGVVDEVLPVEQIGPRLASF